MSKISIQNTTGPFLHTVFFWLNNPNDRVDRYEFEKAIKKLIKTNPQATANHLGCPANSKNRDVVDNSFTYCYTMSFTDLKSQNDYQSDPTHLLFIKEAKHLWKKVRVYDSLSI